MKRYFYIIFLLLLSASCSKDVIPEVVESKSESVSFSFDAITESAQWKSYSSMEQMLDACQIPETILKDLSTEELIRICLSHPLAFTYTAYNNEMTGAVVVFENFNGFQELNSRKDKLENLMKIYEDVELNTGAKSGTAVSPELSSSVGLGFLELYLASDENKELYSPQYVETFSKIVERKYEQKKGNPQTYMMLSLRKSYLLKAKIAVAESTVQGEDKMLIQEFIDNGGILPNREQFKKVESIIIK